ncbi:orotidine-5'-phosphate decarboxylase [Lapidilactobacillus achengensis]|uniref:Orotidine 5'-phosphate decarboxylase n=1 Tax=Lapidilactobacillus achengensis TaxID=2486000 RepID=A0ABW1ULX3_9LACO|nr:orotidine-5'-phosphate decarboxylase [Lapidilactobacillus achengensis]
MKPTIDPSDPKRPIIALDFPSKTATLRFLKKFPQDEHLFVKVGMELYYSAGPVIVEQLIEQGHDVFLDLKLHDIPHTVERAMRVIAGLGVRYTDVHAAGGSDMMLAARTGLEDGTAAGQPVPKLLAITQLTSTSEQQMQSEQLVNATLNTSVSHYARLAQKAWLAGVVCSAQEASMLAQITGPEFLRVTPGIRLVAHQAGSDDQKRIMTPEAAAAQGSSQLVVGRPITEAADPVSVYHQIKQLWEEASHGLNKTSKKSNQ